MKRNKEIFDMCFCSFEQNLELWLSDLKRKKNERKEKRWNKAGIIENRISGYIPGFFFSSQRGTYVHKHFYGVKKREKENLLPVQ